MGGIAFAFAGERQVARGDRHGAAMGELVADDRIAAIIGRLQPLVAVGRPAVGRFDAAAEVAGLR